MHVIDCQCMVMRALDDYRWLTLRQPDLLSQLMKQIKRKLSYKRF